MTLIDPDSNSGRLACSCACSWPSRRQFTLYSLQLQLKGSGAGQTAPLHPSIVLLSVHSGHWVLKNTACAFSSLGRGCNARSWACDLSGPVGLLVSAGPMQEKAKPIV